MNTARVDLVTGRSVIIATARRTLRHTEPWAGTPPFESDSAHGDPHRPCPFCPGAESETEATEQADTDAQGVWQVRVVRNRFPIVMEQTTSLEAWGIHELVIESPLHDTDLVRCAPEQLVRIVRMYRNRVRTLHDQPEVVRVMLFRNRGMRAGSSLVHPHTQIAGMRIVPPHVAEREARMTAFLRTHRMHPLTHERERARIEGRIVADTQSFTVLSPYAPSRNHETWIVPHRVDLSFSEIDDSIADDFAHVLGLTLRCTHHVTRGAAYNVLLHETILPEGGSFHLEIHPRTSGDAGFELVSGLRVVTVTPEDTAEQLSVCWNALQRAVAQRDSNV